MAEKAANSTPIYQLKVTLTRLRPPIWRRLQVNSDITLGKLHHILQAAMGWSDYHMHSFEAYGEFYGIADPELEFKSESRIKLRDVAPNEKSKFRYEYDFGDSWVHDIVVEKILPAAAETRYPVCIKGMRACPPEDCGGVWGYMNLVEIMADPNHPEYEDRKEWLDEDFDPDAFDIDAVNRELKKIR